MDVKGMWKIRAAQIMNMTDDGLVTKWQTAEEIMADDEAPDYIKKMLPSEFLIDDKEIKIIMPIPEGVTQEEIDEAVAAGEAALYGDDKMIVESHPVEERNGKVFFDTGTKGEVFGEPIDPWTELEETENGIIFMSYELVRA